MPSKIIKLEDYWLKDPTHFLALAPNLGANLIKRSSWKYNNYSNGVGGFDIEGRTTKKKTKEKIK